MEYTTQRLSKTNIERVNEMADGDDFDKRLEKILDTVEYWDEDLIESKIEEKMQEANY